MPGGIGGVADPKKDTRTDAREESATEKLPSSKRSSGDSVVDQDLAQGILEYVAKVLVFVVYLGPKKGEVAVRTRSFNKEGFAGKITSRAGECSNKIRR